MRRILTLLIELGVVAVAVFVADWLQGFMDIIPQWLIHLPEVDYASDDFWVVFRYFLVIHAVVLGVGQVFLGAWMPADARRSVNEVFLLAVAFSASALVVFVTTTVAFDPQFVVGIFVVSGLAIILIHLISAVSQAGPGAALLNFFRMLIRRVFSIPGILAMVFALSPGILAKLFVSNRDVANVITQIRIKMSTDEQGGWTVENALDGRKFHQPIVLQFLPERPDTMFVLERQGSLLEVPWRRDGEVKVLLDISPEVGEVEVENGALGLALHPEFGREGSPNRGFVYLYYTSVINGQQINYLSRFDLTAGSPAAVHDSELKMIVWDRSESGFHNGGSVEFGPDGFLYIGVGEMSDGKSHQRIDSALSGGVLRIDVDRRGGNVSKPISQQPVNGSTANYYIPLDNPFVGVSGALEEFYALGLRNPFRLAFDAKTNRIWAGDVGSTVWEEVNVIEKGKNYQYPYIEGDEPTGEARPARILGEEKPPIYSYRHTALERAIIGGLVYRGDRYPSFRGKYLYGDNYSGNIYAMPATGDRVSKVELVAQANQYAQRGITSFTESPDGEILLTTLGSASSSGGEIVRLIAKDEAREVAQPIAASDEVVGESEVRSLFSTNCSRCHGAAGHGDGPDSAHLGVAVPDFSSDAFQKSRTDEHLYAVIKEGGQANGLSPMMPPWGMALSDAEIKALVGFMRAQGEGARGR